MHNIVSVLLNHGENAFDVSIDTVVQVTHEEDSIILCFPLGVGSHQVFLLLISMVGCIRQKVSIEVGEVKIPLVDIFRVARQVTVDETEATGSQFKRDVHASFIGKVAASTSGHDVCSNMVNKGAEPFRCEHYQMHGPEGL